ncbi:MAG: VWA domain-containing protein [Anaerolineaceae bacterium]|nr:MAG: VWA domain-containing protein [Anaerolineaceae bacterium]
MTNWNKNPYRVLGVPQGASVKEIRSVYRNVANRLHPDKNPNNAAAAAQFQEVALAHEILSNAHRRQAYDDRPRTSTYEFTMRTLSSRKTLRVLDEPQVIYLLTKIQPDPAAKEEIKNRPTRLNLTLVLDQSNSMKGARIEKVKIAAHQIIDNLSDMDILSVVTFNDRSETIIEATPAKDKPSLKAKVSLIAPSGGTEIHKGLEAGAIECRKFLQNDLVNHIILLTDGHTFGDQERTLELVDELTREGIGVSAMGLGHDWNDQFLDDLASRSGGTSSYITSANAVVRFLNDHVRSLVNAFAERMSFFVAVDAGVKLESAFRLSPSPQPLKVGNNIIPLGSLQIDRPISVLFQINLPANMEVGRCHIARIAAEGNVLSSDPPICYDVNDIVVNTQHEPTREETPSTILEALSKLTLYKLQERAQEAIEQGDADEATKRLKNLATRFLAMGQEELAQQASEEAGRIHSTRQFSERGRKTLKYQTRHLLDGGDQTRQYSDEAEE